MNSIHDMGGMHGFGRIPYKAAEPVFHEAWQGRVFAIAMYTRGVPNGFRYMVEKIDPTLYLAYTYYEKWMHAKTQGFLEDGGISAAELADKIDYFLANPDEKPTAAYNPEKVKKAVAATYKQQEPDPPQDNPPLFSVGQMVRAQNMHPVGHTRLPRYCRGRRCTIEKYYGYWWVDDTPPAGEDHAIEPLYRVKFEARELWGDEAEANHFLYIDMFESYLVPLDDAVSL